MTFHLECAREGCDNKISEESPMELCFNCRKYLQRIVLILHRPFKHMPYKTLDEIRNYGYKVCYMKGCKGKVFLRNKCRKHYIQQVGEEGR